MNLFQKLPTFTWLSQAGIVPSSSTTYNRDDIVSALQASSAYGFVVGLECNHGALYQINYYYNVSADFTYRPLCQYLISRSWLDPSSMATLSASMR